MSKRQLLMLLGILVMAFLFLGLPFFFDKILALLVGFLILVVAYRLPPEVRSNSRQVPYVEHRATPDNRPRV